MSRVGGRVPWRDVLLTFLILEGLVVAWWLVDASVHIVGWPSSGPVRVALLAPLRHVEWATAVALALAFALRTRVPAIQSFMPMLAAWLWAVPYLPWLPDRLPLLLVLAGPLRWCVLAAALAASLVRAVDLRPWFAVLARPPRAWVFAFSFLAYAGFGLFAVSAHGLVGDEPHYLIINESLLKDRDLKIENNHQQKDYRSYFFGELRPDYMQRGIDAEIYSIHAPGLPAITLPVYALGGHRGVIVFIALLAALAALAIFDLADRLAGPAAATLTWLAVAGTSPFIPYAWSIFPEMPGAFVVAYAALWLWEERPRSLAVWALRGAALGLLPWLHTRFVIMSLVFGAAFAWRLLRRPAVLTAFAIPAVVSAIAWFYSFYAIYGIWNPEAPYGAYAAEFVRFSNIPHGLVGILFDQKFGLLFYSPVYLAAPVGCWWLLKERDSRLPVSWLIALVVAYVVSTTRLYMFWGGSSAPARFLVPILPCLAPMVAVAIARVRHPLWRGSVGLWVVMAVAIASYSMVAPNSFILYSEPHGRARVLEMFQAASPLALTVPTFTDPDWATFLPLLAWWMAVAVLAIVVAAAVATRTRSGAWAALAIASALFVVGGAVVTARPSADIRGLTAERGALELLERFDGPSQRVFVYRGLRKATPEDVRALATITVRPPMPVPEDGSVAGPLTFPPGRYVARVWFAGTTEGSGEVAVGARGQATFAVYRGALRGTVELPFEIPITVGRLMVRVADGAMAAAVTRVDVVPEIVVPSSARDRSPVYAVESLPSRDGALIAYTNEHSYPEHGTFWTRGQGTATLLIAPAGATEMTLFFSTGPNVSTVTWRVANDVEQQTAVPAGEEVSARVPLTVGTRLVPLTIRSNTMFRPGEVDAASTDMRGLGVRVRVVFE